MTYIHLILLAAVAAAPATSTGNATIKPGQWSVTVSVKSAGIPGLPPSVAKAMQGQPRGFSDCISAEQAISGPQELLREAPGCTFTSWSATGGKISADMRCSRPGGTMTSHSSGTYTATTFRVDSDATISGRIAMKLSSTTVGRWISQCMGR